MTPNSADSRASNRIAAIVAAVQAYLDGENRQDYGATRGFSAWRREAIMPAQAHIHGRQRSWTGRD